MGNKLFGEDIAGQVATELGPLLMPGTLTKEPATVREFGEQTGGLDPLSRSHSFRGMFYQQTAFGLNVQPMTLAGQGTLVETVKGAVLILGDTITPPAEPEANDLVTIEGQTFRITAVAERDPDKATYLCHVA